MKVLAYLGLAFWLTWSALMLTGCIVHIRYVRYGSTPVIVSDVPCTSSGHCPYPSWTLDNGGELLGFYSKQDDEIVLRPGYSAETLGHEECHVLLDSHCQKASVSILCWNNLPEAADFALLPNPATQEYYSDNQVKLEQAVNVCMLYFLHPDRLTPAEYEWANKWLG